MKTRNLSVGEVKRILENVPDNYLFGVGTRNKQGKVMVAPEFTGSTFEHTENKVFVLFHKDAML